jgi:TonB-linked SusC/RagA family outer membrane protein
MNLVMFIHWKRWQNLNFGKTMKKFKKIDHLSLLGSFKELLLMTKVFACLICFMSLIILAGTTNSAYAQQQKSITGKITDSSGLPLPGVAVVIKSTTQGTVTNSEGIYTINSVPENAVLVFSFVGMLTQEVKVVDQTSINVIMQVDAIGIEEVVTIGYGTQKKANLTGSVSTVSGTVIMQRPAPNVQNLLQGRASGLQVTQSGGTPGADAATIRIRGFGTFSGTGSDPLVLIDGVEGNMTFLDPNNVEDVSVLKDAASAAIYGARAANGVILITTKRGKSGDVSIDYHATFEAQEPTRLPDLLYNSADYMQYWNEANKRAGMVTYFTQAEIDAFRNAEGKNDPKYPNFDWVDHMYKTAFVQNHHLSVNGGNERTQFNMAVGYFDQGGIVPLFDFKRYNMQLNVDTKINDWLKVGGNVQLLRSDKEADVQSTYNDAYFIMHTFGPGPNYTPTMTLPDGSTGYVARYSSAIAEWTVRNPDAMIAQGSNLNQRYYTAPQIYAEINLTKDLTWYTKGAALFDYNWIQNHENAVNNYYFKDGSFAHNGAVWHQGVEENIYTRFNTTLYSTLNYKKSFKEAHNLNVLGGYNQETSYSKQLGGSKITFPTDNLKELNAGSATGQTTRGTASEWAIQSFFGRINYDYKSRYLLELNGRYDGTSRIAPDTRWGFFPSASAAWRISSESFMKNINWLSNLKFRGSWGQLGNQNVGLYPYQDVLSTTQYAFAALEPGARLTRLVDKTLQWETTTVTDIGIDLSIKNGLFSLTADWYDKVTDDILYSIPVPASIGLSAPTVNGGQMKNTGWEFEATHAYNIGKVKYDVNFNISFYKNEVTSIISPTIGTNIVKEGLPYQEWYMVEWDGIFQNQAEIDAAPKHQFNPKPGDLRFKDQLTIDSNNDGIMDKADGVIDSKDRVVVGGRYPKFYYGGGFNIYWKDFDVSLFLQGVEGTKSLSRNWGITPYEQGSPPTKDFVKNHWTGEGSTNKYPAMYRAGYNPVTGTVSTFHLYDSSYLRLKNLRIGYNIPNAYAQRIGLKQAQVYFSGDNLLTFTDYPGMDPERTSGSFSVYPQLRTYAFGIKVKL